MQNLNNQQAYLIALIKVVTSVTGQPNNIKAFQRKYSKDLQKALPILDKSINLEGKHIAKKIKLSNQQIAETSTCVSLKGHKDNFRSNSSCHLINSSKSNQQSKAKFFDRKSTKTCCPNLTTIRKKPLMY